MNGPASSPQASQERLAEKFGELRGLAANRGGDRLSDLLIGLITLIIAALRSIAGPVEATAIPAGTAPQTFSRHNAETHGRPKAAPTAPARPRRPRTRKPKPAARKADAPARKIPAVTVCEHPPSRPPEAPRPACRQAWATAPPRRRRANRTSRRLTWRARAPVRSKCVPAA